MAQPGALAHVDDAALISEIAAGAYLKDIASRLGVCKQAVSLRLRKHPEYRQALETRYEQQLDQAQADLERASEPLDIARAREIFRAAAWRAEREFPERWGARAQGVGSAVVHVHIAPSSAVSVSSDGSQVHITGNAALQSVDNSISSDITDVQVIDSE